MDTIAEAPRTLGRYRLLARLGEGGMGVVYEALDPAIDRRVAIKVVKLTLVGADRAEFTDRFYREARSAGRLGHPNVVTIFDVGESEDVAWIAMEFIEGRTLRQMLDTGERLPVGRACLLAAQVADALAHAHRQGVVHRDIKPANIMITRDGIAKVMDFGIATVPNAAQTHSGTVLGSPKYMAPEQIRGLRPDGRADVYALGAVLYELLTGSAPFEAESVATVLYRVINVPPVDASRLDPRVPPAVDAILARALAKDPDARHASADELACELRAAVDTVEVHAPPVAATARPSGSPDDTTVVLDAVKVTDAATAPAHDGSAPATSNAWRHRRRWLMWGMIGVAVLAALVAGQRGAKRVQEARSDRAAATAPAAAASQPGAAPVAPSGMGAVTFDVHPGGDIWVDGRRVGSSPPLGRVPLAAGPHRVEIRGCGTPPQPFMRRVEVVAGKTQVIRFWCPD